MTHKLDENKTPDERKKYLLEYNEKEQNVKNIVFDPCQNFMESNHSRYPRQSTPKLYAPRQPLQSLTRATHELTITTPPTLSSRFK